MREYEATIIVTVLDTCDGDADPSTMQVLTASDVRETLQDNGWRVTECNRIVRCRDCIDKEIEDWEVIDGKSEPILWCEWFRKNVTNDGYCHRGDDGHIPKEDE